MKTQPDNSKLARKYGVAARTIREWRQAKAPLDSPAAMREWLAGRRRGSDQTQAEARRRYYLAKAEREELRLAQDRGQLLDAGKVNDDIAHGMADLFGALEAEFVERFPAAARGMDEVGIRAAAIRHVEAMKTKLRELWAGGEFHTSAPKHSKP